MASGVKNAVVSESLAHSSDRQHRANERAAKQAEVVRAAVEEGKVTVLRHIELGRLLGDNSRKLAELIQNKIEALQADPENVDEGLLFTLTRAHEAVARATANTIQIERQARGLDDLPSDPSMPAAINITYYRSDHVLNNNAGPAAEPAIRIKAIE